MFRNSFPNGLSATMVAGLDKCCARADCLAGSGTAPGSICAVRTVAGTMVGYRSSGNLRVSAQRIARMWRTRLTRTGMTASGTHTPVASSFLSVFIRATSGGIRIVSGRLFLHMYISPLWCGQPNRQEIARLMTCARGNSRAVLLENRQGRAARWMDGGGQAPLQLRRSAVTPTGRCHVPARTMPVCAGAPAAWLAEALLS